MRAQLVTLSALSLFLMIGTPALAAADVGTIEGTVTDKSNQPAAGIDVRLFSNQGSVQAPTRKRMPGQQQAAISDRPVSLGGAGQGKPVASTTTDKAGKFQFTNVKAGAYTLIIAPTATTGAYRQNLNVTANQTSTVTIQLGEPERQ